MRRSFPNRLYRSTRMGWLYLFNVYGKSTRKVDTMHLFQNAGSFLTLLEETSMNVTWSLNDSRLGVCVCQQQQQTQKLRSDTSVFLYRSILTFLMLWSYVSILKTSNQKIVRKAERSHSRQEAVTIGQQMASEEITLILIVDWGSFCSLYTWPKYFIRCKI